MMTMVTMPEPRVLPATLTLDITVQCAEWERALADARAVAEAAALAAFTGEPGSEAGVTLADDAFVRGLNRRYRHRDEPTNVLSFANLDGAGPHAAGAPLLLGDIVVAFETARREAGEAGRPLDQHLAHLVVHGMLHLLGHDHQDATEAERMERLEANILATIGVPDPYRETTGAGAP